MIRKKSIMMDYMDACELIKETEKDIRKLYRKEIVSDRVTGSSHEFPYRKKSFHISGISETSPDNEELLKEHELLVKRMEYAASVKRKVEDIMEEAPLRIQRIIRYKYFEKLTWDQVAAQIGNNASADSVKKEYQRFMQEK